MLSVLYNFLLGRNNGKHVLLDRLKHLLLFQFSPHVFLFHNNNILNAFGTTSARLIIEKLFMRTILAATVILAHNGLLILMVLFILHSFIKAYFLAAGLLQLVVDFTGGFD